VSPVPHSDRYDQRRHPCGCETYYDLATWRSVTTVPCADHDVRPERETPTVVVLPVDDTGARRLAEAIAAPELFRRSIVQRKRIENARVVLDRLAEGGERDG
jgi:hypothetical protein